MRGSLVKKGNNYYAVLDMGRGADGKRHPKWVAVGPNEKRGEERLIELVHQYNNGVFVKPTKQTVGQFFQRWLADYAAVNVRPRTLEGYRQKVRQYIDPYIGHVPLKQLQPAHLQTAYRQMLEKGRANGKGGLSPMTVKHAHRLISEGLNHAMRWGLVPKERCDVH
ncbi:MAG: hypothetical protein HYX87_00055 [Chloroflexi bacterium]|nr:hypothetical protein [Chloroflexota bacterium]